MKLAEYLAANHIRLSQFAAQIGKPASTITRLIHGQRQPSLALAAAIAEATSGAVTANDFVDALPTPLPPFPDEAPAAAGDSREVA